MPSIQYAKVIDDYARLDTETKMRVMTAISQTLGCSRVEPRPGDEVVVVKNCTTPLLLRKSGDSKNYQLVGAAFVRKIMKGEALDKIPEREVIIV